MRLLISGGGTGGHVYPALTVVAALRKQTVDSSANVISSEASDPGTISETLRSAQSDNAAGLHQFLYLGRADSVEARLAERAQIPFHAIETGQVRGKAPWTMARSLWRMYASIGKIRGIIREFKPSAIFVTGGYVSAPVIWAGAAEKIPSVIFLPDLEPGWAIRATARWATKVAVSFPEVEKHFAPGKAITTGYPVRAEFFNIDKQKARARFHLEPDKRTIAIFGGSTGAHHINQAALDQLVALTKFAQIVFLTGRADEAWVNDQVSGKMHDLRARVRVFGYLEEDLPQALSCADLVIARAGAATLAEFPALGLPAILVPGPYAGLHQRKNAQFLVERGAAVIVDDAALPTELLPTVEKLLNAPDKLSSMQNAMRALAQPDAAENIVALLAEISKR